MSSHADVMTSHTVQPAHNPDPAHRRLDPTTRRGKEGELWEGGRLTGNQTLPDGEGRRGNCGKEGERERGLTLLSLLADGLPIM